MLVEGDLLVEFGERVDGGVGGGDARPRDLVGDLGREPLQVRRHLPLLLAQVALVLARLLEVLHRLRRPQGLLLGQLRPRQGLHKGAVVLIFQRVIM